MIQKGFTQSDIVDAKLAEYMIESDSVQLFISEKQIVTSDSKTISRMSLYKGYQMFCQSDGYKSCSKIVFHQRLTDLGFRSRRMSDGHEYFAEVKQAEEEFKPRISFKPEFDPQKVVRTYSEFDQYFTDED
jgi:phage/plasmid-associated DNA primase